MRGRIPEPLPPEVRKVIERAIAEIDGDGDPERQVRTFRRAAARALERLAVVQIGSYAEKRANELRRSACLLRGEEPRS